MAPPSWPLCMCLPDPAPTGVVGQPRRALLTSPPPPPPPPPPPARARAKRRALSRACRDRRTAMAGRDGRDGNPLGTSLNKGATQVTYAKPTRCVPRPALALPGCELGEALSQPPGRGSAGARSRAPLRRVAASRTRRRRKCRRAARAAASEPRVVQACAAAGRSRASAPDYRGADCAGGAQHGGGRDEGAAAEGARLALPAALPRSLCADKRPGGAGGLPAAQAQGVRGHHPARALEPGRVGEVRGGRRRRATWSARAPSTSARWT